MKEHRIIPLELSQMGLSHLAVEHLFEIASGHNQTILEAVEACIHAAYLRQLNAKRTRALEALDETLKRCRPETDDDVPW
ncbi:MAG: hypothetical protein AAF718_03550 [Pseudomonadota bacterium]